MGSLPARPRTESTKMPSAKPLLSQDGADANTPLLPVVEEKRTVGSWSRVTFAESDSDRKGPQHTFAWRRPSSAGFNIGWGLFCIVFLMCVCAAKLVVQNNVSNGASLGEGLLRMPKDDISTLPPVDWANKILLIVVGLPFSGTSALEGLIGTSAAVTDLCAAGTWQCEDSELLTQLGFVTFIDEEDTCAQRWDPEQPTPTQFAYAFTDFALKYWDMSKDLLLDKSPPLLGKHVNIKAAAAMLGVRLKFVVLTRHPFSWSPSKPFNETKYLDRMRHALNALQDPSVESLQVQHMNSCLSSALLEEHLFQFCTTAHR